MSDTVAIFYFEYATMIMVLVGAIDLGFQTDCFGPSPKGPIQEYLGILGSTGVYDSGINIRAYWGLLRSMIQE